MLSSGQIPEGRLLVAFSGGEDSLFLLHQLSLIAPERTGAVYINHGIRSDDELETEEALNRANASHLGIPLYIIRLEKGAVSSLASAKGTEAAARELRYRAIERCREENGYDWILTAHHREDQAETVIMRILSSSPIWAYSGIMKSEGRIFRPILSVPKHVIADAVRKAGLCPSSDSTNDDTSYLRNSIRKNIMPYISEEAKDSLASLALKCQMLRCIDVPLTHGFYLSADRAVFDAASPQSKERAIYRAFSLLGSESRISRNLIRDIEEKSDGQISSAGISVYILKKEIRFYRDIDNFAAPFSFGRFFDSLSFFQEAEDGRTLIIDIPSSAIVRKSRTGDEIILRSGCRKVKALEKEWRVPYSIILEDREGIAAVFARFLGGSDRLSSRFIGRAGVPVSLRATPSGCLPLT